jgi:hypothetical protein
MTDPMYAIPGSTAHAIHLTGWQMGRDEERARVLKLINKLFDEKVCGCIDEGFSNCYEGEFECEKITELAIAVEYGETENDL